MQKLVIFLMVLLVACKGKKENHSTTSSQAISGDTLNIEYAKGFSLVNYGHYKILKIKNPYPEANKTFTYLLTQKGVKPPKGIKYDAKILIPVHKIVVTSTTHIPALVSLGEVSTLVGFPNLKFISAPAVRKRIDNKKIAELGTNTHLNTEVLLSLQPDVVIGFTMKSNDKVYSNIEKMAIPVIYDGDWNEKSPLGRAEWIKFFGALYNKQKQATQLFDSIRNSYLAAKKLAAKAKNYPTVLAGAMYKDVWYLPNGKSWVAKFFNDAHANYLYKNTSGSGSLSLSFESVLNKAQHADFWISPGGFYTYQALLNASEHYQKFDAFQNKKIYTYANVKGATGGVLFYELGPSRPDLVLKDLIHIFHPHLLPHYTTTFYKPMQ